MEIQLKEMKSFMSQCTLQQKIKDRTLTVGILGLGYVGLPLFLWHAESDISVIGFDTDEGKIKSLNANRSYIERYSHEDIGMAMQRGARVTGNFELIYECDVIIICVPTPLNQYREPDLSYVTSTLQSLGPHLRQNQLVSLEKHNMAGNNRRNCGAFD